MNPSARPFLRIKRLILLIPGVSLALSMQAQVSSEKSLDWQLGAGNTYLYDDYLSPLAHEGLSFQFSTQSTKPLDWGLRDSQDVSFDRAKWIRVLQFSLVTVAGESPAKSDLYHGTMDIQASLLRQVFHRPNWNLSLGPDLEMGGGGRLCLQNGNNPGSADIYLNLGVALSTDYQFKWKKKNLRLNYQASLALSGLAFSPEYAESYYEIFYLGNDLNVVKFTQPFNTRQWSQRLLLDVPLSHKLSSLRLGWRNDGRISLYNQIRTRVLSTHFSLGYIRYFRVL